MAHSLLPGAVSLKKRAVLLSPSFLPKELGPHVARAACAERPGSGWLPGTRDRHGGGRCARSPLLPGPLVLPTWGHKEHKRRQIPGRMEF